MSDQQPKYVLAPPLPVISGLLYAGAVLAVIVGVMDLVSNSQDLRQFYATPGLCFACALGLAGFGELIKYAAHTVYYLRSIDERERERDEEKAAAK